MMVARNWSSALSPHRPPVPGGLHWAAGTLMSLILLGAAVYIYADNQIPNAAPEGEAVESMIVALGAPAQKLEPPPPAPETPPPEPAPPQKPTERADDAPPPAPPPQPRPIAPPAPTDGPLSSGFDGAAGIKPAPQPPPPPKRELDKSFIDISTAQYAERANYPFEALRRHQQGHGTIQIVIDRTGKVLDWKLAGSTGHKLLDREIRRVAGQVKQLDPLPAYYQDDTAILIIPFTFIMDAPEQ